MQTYDRVILGAGIYGLYAAGRSAEKGLKTLVLDMEKRPFRRGSYINQARLHNGYHYPRSYATASKSAHYFERFMRDYGDCVNTDFDKIYAVAKEYSWTNGAQFYKFCKNLDLRCERIGKERYFNPQTVEDAFLTKEYTFDADLLRDKLEANALRYGCEFAMGERIKAIGKKGSTFQIDLVNEQRFASSYVLNSTYAGTNQIHRMLGYELLPLKYELCEVALCEVSDNIKKVGLTVMDGPFFSVMPFGRSGHHSITTVSRTPHLTCYDPLPTFECQRREPACTPDCCINCNPCAQHPITAFEEMAQTARKYLRSDIEINYIKSLFTIKPILKASEIDDSRPTLIRQYSETPDFYTVFSGKINTMYDLDSIL